MQIKLNRLVMDFKISINQLMKSKDPIFLRSLTMIAPIFFLSITMHAQEKERTILDDTTEYDTYRMMQGHRVAKSKFGELNIRSYAYFRYLNQLGYDKTYVDGFGKTQQVDPRQDIQLQKVSIYFTGWAFDPKLNYFLYMWTSNASQGQG